MTGWNLPVGWSAKRIPYRPRVAVNRFWEQIFGLGLVPTMEEFGSQGALPSHPELLDWLAIRFVKKHRWQVKPFLKELLLSATYRQSSKTDPDALEKDPSNKWLSRSGRTRLSAETNKRSGLSGKRPVEQEDRRTKCVEC